MTEFKQPIDYVPKCIRLFFFFSVMAWVSLFKPEEGQRMIDNAHEGIQERARKEIYKDWQGYYWPAAFGLVAVIDE